MHRQDMLCQFQWYCQIMLYLIVIPYILSAQVKVGPNSVDVLHAHSLCNGFYPTAFEVAVNHDIYFYPVVVCSLPAIP